MTVVLKDICETSAVLPFTDLSRQELNSYLEQQLGIKSAYRSTQLFEWVYRHRVTDFRSMTNLSKSLRESCAEQFFVPLPEVVNRAVSLDGTKKFLFDVGSGRQVETVLIKQPNRMTLCVSSQVGCGMGCTFCRTAQMGFQANLSASQIVQQVWGALEDTGKSGEEFGNIVFMGMGEPLHNVNNVVRAVRILTDPYGFGFAPRKITVSTVGLVPAIQKFAQADTGVCLAVSLNATTDEVRSTIMPVNNRFPLQNLLDSLRSFPLGKRRKITIEYVMLSGVNDTEADLKRLPGLLHGLKTKINLIPYNENAALGYSAPKREWVRYWYQELKKKEMDVTIRWSKGIDIDAACGQLAVKHIKGEATAS